MAVFPGALLRAGLLDYSQTRVREESPALDASECTVHI